MTGVYSGTEFPTVSPPTAPPSARRQLQGSNSCTAWAKFKFIATQRRCKKRNGNEGMRPSMRHDMREGTIRYHAERTGETIGGRGASKDGKEGKEEEGRPEGETSALLITLRPIAPPRKTLCNTPHIDHRASATHRRRSTSRSCGVGACASAGAGEVYADGFTDAVYADAEVEVEVEVDAYAACSPSPSSKIGSSPLARRGIPPRAGPTVAADPDTEAGARGGGRGGGEDGAGRVRARAATHPASSPGGFGARRGHEHRVCNLPGAADIFLCGTVVSCCTPSLAPHAALDAPYAVLHGHEHRVMLRRRARLEAREACAGSLPFRLCLLGRDGGGGGCGGGVHERMEGARARGDTRCEIAQRAEGREEREERRGKPGEQLGLQLRAAGCGGRGARRTGHGEAQEEQQLEHAERGGGARSGAERKGGRTLDELVEVEDQQEQERVLEVVAPGELVADRRRKREKHGVRWLVPRVHLQCRRRGVAESRALESPVIAAKRKENRDWGQPSSVGWPEEAKRRQMMRGSFGIQQVT
ncbi:hypothetical protein FB451DRAFT_1192886 [Mycena latifolia]|nr:hypothetical protein FB451DRAFT_1192886 [Mycena latifolia]